MNTILEDRLKPGLQREYNFAADMKVNVKLFAAARDAAGASEVPVDVDEGASIADLRSALRDAYPRLAPLVERSMFAVNASYAQDEDVIPGNAEVACIPPVSGG